MIDDKDKLPLPLSCFRSSPEVFSDNPALWHGRSDLEHTVKTFAIESISDFKSVNIEGGPLSSKVDCDFDSLSVSDSCSTNLDGNDVLVSTVGKRSFWRCKDLSGPISYSVSTIPTRSEDVEDYMLLQCDNMLGMPYMCKGCCFMLFDGFVWECGVIVRLCEDCLEYKKFSLSCKEASLDNTVYRIEMILLTMNYVFKFVNVFHRDISHLHNFFLHHCVINEIGNIEGMLKPSIWKDDAPESEFLSRKMILLKKGMKRKVKHVLVDNGSWKIKQRGGCLAKVILKPKEEFWHTIYVKKSHKNTCAEICKKHKLKKSFYIVVPSPIFDVKEENWIVLSSGFRYCYREHFIIDVRYFSVMKKLNHITQLHKCLSDNCVGRVNLIQPCDCRNTRFCVVNSCQFKSIRKEDGIETMSTNNNLYLYEYSNRASWRLPGCVVSSWETEHKLPEFDMKEVKNLFRAVKKGTKRRCTQNKGIYLTLGPRLSHRPKPNPVIQEENKLHFSDFYRQEWKCQESMYLLRSKLCHAGECVRQRSVALNPGYMKLVGHYCCARQLLSSGVCKFKEDQCRDESMDTSAKGKKGNNVEDNPIGYVNSLHDDTCDLIQKEYVPLFMERFISLVRSSKNYSAGTKSKLIKKLKEINSLIGLGFPTTCGHNIICNESLEKVAKVSSLFIMFDFAMTLSHKTVHNFFGWAFVHCTALPMLIFHDGSVQLSNDDADDDHSVVVFAWGNNGGSKESGLNTKMKSSEQNTDERKERDDLSNRVVDRISIME